MNEQPIIQTIGLTRQFDQKVAVCGVDLQVRAGEVYGLIGPNGAGKTTLLRMLAGVEEPSYGEIYIYGERFSRDRVSQTIKRRIGYLPDNFPLYEDLTVWNYLEYFARLYRLTEPRRTQRLMEVLDLVQLVGKRRSQVSTLSRGMKQRLGLARTLVHEPVLLLLDEPVSGLDPVARVQFREVIKTLQEAGMAIVISSHILSDMAELCSSIGVMELGRLVESNSLDSLYKKLGRTELLLSTLGDRQDLLAVLHRQPHIESWQLLPDPGQVSLRYSGTAKDRAQLLCALVEAGIELHEFHLHQETLESIVLKMGHQEVS